MVFPPAGAIFGRDAEILARLATPNFWYQHS